MLIGFIKRNRSLSPVVLPMAVSLLWIRSFLSGPPAPLEDAMPVYSFIAGLLFSVPFLASSVSLLLLLMQAFLVNRIIEANEVLNNHSFLPGLVYMLLMSADPDMLTATPVLFSNLFLLLALHTLLKTYRLEKAYSGVFDSGLYISLASLFYLPSALFLALIWAGLIILRPFVWREWIISALGFCVPWTLLIGFFYWQGPFPEMPSTILNSIGLLKDPFWQGPYHLSTGQLFLLPVLVLIILFSAGRFLHDLGSGTVRTRSNLFVIMNFFLLSCLAVLLAPVHHSTCLAAMTIPASIYFSGYFIGARRAVIPEILILLLIISIFINQYIP